MPAHDLITQLTQDGALGQSALNIRRTLLSGRLPIWPAPETDDADQFRGPIRIQTGLCSSSACFRAAAACREFKGLVGSEESIGSSMAEASESKSGISAKVPDRSESPDSCAKRIGTSGTLKPRPSDSAEGCMPMNLHKAIMLAWLGTWRSRSQAEYVRWLDPSAEAISVCDQFQARRIFRSRSPRVRGTAGMRVFP